MMSDDDELENNLHWHALNYRTAGTLEAEAMWQELQACVNRLLSAKDEEIARLKEDVEHALMASNAEARYADELKADAERYKFVRAMNSRDFHDLWVINIRSGVSFDELVDNLAAKEREQSTMNQQQGEGNG